MGFLEKISENKFLLHTKIKPNSKNQRILDDNDYLIIFLRSKPVQNKANNELINLLKKKLNLSPHQIKIISGLKSSIKIIKLTYGKSISEKNIIKELLD